MINEAKLILDRLIKEIGSGNTNDIKFGNPLIKLSYFEDKARLWDIKIRTVKKNKNYIARYFPKKNHIHLTTTSKLVFLHELVHACDIKFMISYGQDPSNDIIAEMAAQTLFSMLRGKTRNFKRSCRYIEVLASPLDQQPFEACLEGKEDAEILISLVLSQNPVFKLTTSELTPVFFDTYIEGIIFIMVFKIEDYKISVIEKSQITGNEWEASREVLEKKGGFKKSAIG